MSSSDIEKDNMGGERLTRAATTITITPEQYERLFFQPTPARGDLAKRFGNPTLLGTIGFLVPFQTTCFLLMGFKGGSAASLTSVCGSFYMFGGIAMVIAGLMEFVLGNTFPMVVFIIFGVHWASTGFSEDPTKSLSAAYGTEGALSLPFNTGNAFYNITMMLVCFIFFLGSLRTNAFFVCIFFTLVFLFAFLAAADWYIGYNPTPAGIEYATYLVQIAGGWGFVAALSGWYLAIVTSCASTGVPCPLPILDMSGLFKGSEAAKMEHAGSGAASK